MNVIDNIHKCSGETFWWLWIDYEVSVKRSTTPASISSPRPSPTRTEKRKLEVA